MMLTFSAHPPTVFYIDINSCFATIEQQARPGLRGHPLAVAAFETGNGVILAASIEAKPYGIKTGMRVRDAKGLCPTLKVITPDPEKYRYVNHQLAELLLTYSPHVQVQSIDEMIVRMDQTPLLAGCTDAAAVLSRMKDVGVEIKKRIRNEIGECITVSIGIAPNACLAKTASNITKPDGLEAITRENIQNVLSSMTLTDLCGIKQGNAARLHLHGIETPRAMYETTPELLEHAFGSILGKYWWLWLHGWEIGPLYADQSTEKNKSYSQSSSLTQHTTPMDPRTIQVACQLVAKMAARLREDGCCAGGVMAGCSFSDRSYWHKSTKLHAPVYATEDIFSAVMNICTHAPAKPIHTVFVGVYDVTAHLYSQLTFDEKELQKQARTKAIDRIYRRFGLGAVTTGFALSAQQKIVDRIAFGKSTL